MVAKDCFVHVRFGMFVSYPNKDVKLVDDKLTRGAQRRLSGGLQRRPLELRGGDKVRNTVLGVIRL